jgi:hypothetical protein
MGTHHANTKVFSFTENLESSGNLNAVLSHARGQLGILRGSSDFCRYLV